MANLIDRLINLQPVFLDTSCFIYAFEDNPVYGSVCQQLFDAVSGGKLKAITSIITVSEVLTKPMESDRKDLVESYREIFHQMPNLTIVSPGYDTAIFAAEIRAKYGFRLIDSFQLALAKQHLCPSLISNDKQLKKYEGIKVILPTA